MARDSVHAYRYVGQRAKRRAARGALMHAVMSCVQDWPRILSKNQ